MCSHYDVCVMLDGQHANHLPKVSDTNLDDIGDHADDAHYDHPGATDQRGGYHPIQWLILNREEHLTIYLNVSGAALLSSTHVGK